MKSILVAVSMGFVLAAGPCIATPESGSNASAQAGKGDFKVATPGVLTPSGKQFIRQCDDKAFATTDDERGLANRCERLLIGWWQEAHAHDTHRPSGQPSVGVSYGRPLAGLSAYRNRR